MAFLLVRFLEHAGRHGGVAETEGAAALGVAVHALRAVLGFARNRVRRRSRLHNGRRHGHGLCHRGCIATPYFVLVLIAVDGDLGHSRAIAESVAQAFRPKVGIQRQ